MLLEYMRDVDDKVFKEYSNGNNFNSFINEFKKKKKGKVLTMTLKWLKIVNTYLNYLILLIFVDYFLDKCCKKLASGFNWKKHPKVTKHFM